MNTRDCDSSLVICLGLLLHPVCFYSSYYPFLFLGLRFCFQIMPKLVVAIPVYNEERHINRVYQNAVKLSSSVFFFDSGSTDGTIALVRATSANLVSVPLEINSFAAKLNYIYAYREFAGCLILALHADEIIDDHSSSLIVKYSNALSSSDACMVTRQSFFLGRPLKWGRSSQKSIRLAGFNTITYQNTPLDESIYVNDKSSPLVRTDIRIVDAPLIGPSEWFSKHNRYSSLESKLVCSGGIRDKSLAIRLYYRFPIFVRPFIIFLVRYFFFLGFLDGLSGLAYQLSHSLVYRLMVDVKIFYSASASRSVLSRPHSYD